MHTQSQDTQRHYGSASGQTAPMPRTGRQKGGGTGLQGESCQAFSLSSVPASYRSDSRGEKEPETLLKRSVQPQLNLRQSKRGKRGIPNTRETKGGKERKGTHGSFHVSSESWAGSRHKAAEAAERAAWSRRSCLNYNEPSWASSQDV